MISVEVKNGKLEQAIKDLARRVEKDGVLSKFVENMEFTKKSTNNRKRKQRKMKTIKKARNEKAARLAESMNALVTGKERKYG
jgi:ribosomal protein S21